MGVRPAGSLCCRGRLSVLSWIWTRSDWVSVGQTFGLQKGELGNGSVCKVWRAKTGKGLDISVGGKKSR